MSGWGAASASCFGSPDAHPSLPLSNAFSLLLSASGEEGGAALHAAGTACVLHEEQPPPEGQQEPQISSADSLPAPSPADQQRAAEDQLLEAAVLLADQERQQAADCERRQAATLAIYLRNKGLARARDSSGEPAPAARGEPSPDTTAGAPANQPFDRDDRAINKSDFESVQALSGRTFTLDACSNPCGDNALCGQYCSTEKSFFDHAVIGNHVWLNAPFSQLYDFVDHYVGQKQTSPTNTSACILVPHRGQLAHPALSRMRLLKIFPRGYHLFNAPPAQTGQKRHRLGGLPWPIAVYYDPPRPVNTSSLAMQFHGTAYGMEISVLADTGAKQNYASRRFCEQLGLAVDRRRQTAVTLGNGKQQTSIGTAFVRLQIQGYRAILRFHVMELTTAFDVILGNDWMVHHDAHLLMDAGCVAVTQGMRRLRLHSITAAASPQQTAASEPWPQEPGTGTSSAPDSEMQFLSHLQVKRVMRKKQRHFLVYLRPADPEGEESRDWSSVVANNPEGCCPLRVKQLLQQYSSVFPETLDYPSLPPEREISHTIPLVPGAKPVFRPMFRYSPREREEMETQIRQMLKAGLIEPYDGPWGSPVLFVPKKNGKLRMCVDYRFLNKLTIRNAYPLPRVDDLLDKLHGATCFSGLDLMSGYHQLRIAPDDQEKTAFRTPFGLYKYKVLCFGLVNAPAVFVQMMDSVFRNRGMGTFVLVYLDDILVFSRTPEEHLQHLQSVLQTLQDNQLYANFEKCSFNNAEVEFLGHVVSKHGIKPDPKKVQAVENWPRPSTLKQLRSFLGLAQYFRKFIQGYSKIVAPLNALTKEGLDWRKPERLWSPACEAAFHTVKRHLTEAPVLATPAFSQPFEVVCDASLVAVGAVLLQNGRPVAFESKKLTPAEVGYTTTEQELLAVVHALTVWRCYLEGVKFTVVTDHHPNTFFNEQPLLSRRQARWSAFLQQFDFSWEYRPGRINVADPLSRLVCPTEEESGQAAVASAKCTFCTIQACSDSPSPEQAMSTPLAQQITAGYKQDPWFAVANNTEPLTLEQGLWYREGKVVVPAVPSVKDQILSQAHDSVYAGHFGFHKTLRLVSRQFWWPHMREDVSHWVTSCEDCQRNKSAHLKSPGKLRPLPIPPGKWDCVTVDFVTELPQTEAGYDAVCVFCDKLTKMVHLCPTYTSVSALDTAMLFVQHVWRLHGTPTQLISDRGPQFSSNLFREIMGLLQVDQGLSTAFHPQTDGQTERVNRVMEEVLRSYVNPTQTDWDRWLPCVEFAINNAVHSGTKETPFFLNYGYHPSTPLSLQTPLQRETRLARVPTAVKFTANMYEALAKAKRCLQAHQDRMKRHADASRRELSFGPGQYVWLSNKNIALKHNGTRKLIAKWLGPFKVLSVVNPVAYKLELPAAMQKLHPVFHVSLLKPYQPPRGSRRKKPPPPIVLEDGQEEHEVEAVLAHRIVRRRPEFLIKFNGYGHEHNEWLPEGNLNCPDLLQEYYASPAYARSVDKIVQKANTTAAKAQRQRRKAVRRSERNKT